MANDFPDSYEIDDPQVLDFLGEKFGELGPFLYFIAFNSKGQPYFSPPHV